MSSFVRFVIKYKKSDCAYGDIARDILQDELINRSWGYNTFKIYIETHHNPSERVMTLIEELRALHRVNQAGLYKLKKNNS
jgi:hypothetical protein